MKLKKFESLLDLNLQWGPTPMMLKRREYFAALVLGRAPTSCHLLWSDKLFVETTADHNRLSGLDSIDQISPLCSALHNWWSPSDSTCPFDRVPCTSVIFGKPSYLSVLCSGAWKLLVWGWINNEHILNITLVKNKIHLNKEMITMQHVFWLDTINN